MNASTTNNTLTKATSNYTAVGVTFLLLLYIAGVLHVESFHDLLHSHEHIELHSLAQENDPCHRATYHNEKQNGCKHESHIDIADKCALCGICFSTAHIPVKSTGEQPVVFSFITFNEVSISFPIDFSGYQSSRGPPSA